MISGLRLLCAGVFLLGLGINSQVFSQDATPPGASVLNRKPEAAPGRLFFSPERREALNQQRRTKQFQETVVEGETLTLNGMVTRSSGKWTIWVNGSPVNESDSANVVVAPVAGHSGLGRMNAGGDNGASTVIAVGNAIDRTTGSANPLLGTGSIRVHSRSTRR